ncbi:MAG: Uma2 family endonuclease [Bacteroidota bacterium]
MEVHEPPATYAEYRLLPEDAPRYEIIEGVGYLSPSPGGRHQRVSANVMRALDRVVHRGKHGQLFAAPLDVVFSEENVVQPDILFVARDRTAIIRGRGIFGAPDLVVEILSPSNAAREFQQKFSLYREFGVREYWIIDLENRTVDVWTGKEQPLDTRRVIAGDGTVGSGVLPALAVGLDEIFEGVDEIPVD